MDETKKISILMGIYNCADTLQEAIESILAQDYSNWQLIMCDDGSKDATYEVARRFVDKNPKRMILLRNDHNQGLNYTLNYCLQYADGDYIARMDGDDISLPQRFRKEVEFLNAHPEFAIVSTPMIYFDESGDWGRGRAIERPQITDFVFHAPFHCHAPCMIRREAFQSVGGYTVDPRLLRFEDCNLWYKLYAAGYRGYNLQEPLYKMRDDYNAYRRRSFSSRMRAVYVQYIGFKMIHMPLKYYPFLLVEVCKNFALAIIPASMYNALRKKKKV